ncbi:hypothetical protein VDIAB_250368 [Vibrio diabolicus]|nr:hypothetical protein VDIAB_250368 [Vibrio diabolicus]
MHSYFATPMTDIPMFLFKNVKGEHPTRKYNLTHKDINRKTGKET